MIFILFGEGKKVERVYRLSKESIVYQRENVERRSGGNKSILAMEIHFISTSTSIAFDIFFIQ